MDKFVVNIIHRPELVPEYSATVTGLPAAIGRNQSGLYKQPVTDGRRATIAEYSQWIQQRKVW